MPFQFSSNNRGKKCLDDYLKCLSVTVENFIGKSFSNLVIPLLTKANIRCSSFVRLGFINNLR